ncbi:hypothetical protein GA0061083_0318 [Pseudarthrobacter enclensis]|uniref:Uncharacterized protein n=1 Tax=Pseudarthrobacter enclensis TaxID=993070 RepID=A0A0V8IUU1_9MICC|nr:hypothetical protein [Pseudarthrobacter enclensis]KSU78517.1 hypothetical protein AS031_00165 [Pseudarthrobacter enclensis]SCB72392.1 hypothetical protein GA0061083_0318 [Pseudarthrobacter enclensis]
MNQPSFGQKTGPETQAGTGPSAAAGPGQQAAPAKAGTPFRLAKDANQAVLGPFTVRDLTVFAATLILFIASLLPIFGGRFNLWNLNNLFFLGLGILLPLIVSALFAARRLAPATRLRVGSLSVDQFASVAASFALAFFFISVAGAYVPSLLVGLIGSVILFAATVLGRFIPYLSSDFQGRSEAPAHVMARDAAAPAPAPRTPKQPKPEPAAQPGANGTPGSHHKHEASHKPRLGGKLFGGAGAGSSAVPAGQNHTGQGQAGNTHTGQDHTGQDQAGAGQHAGYQPAGHQVSVPATAAVPAAAAPAAAPVSTAPEAADHAPEVDAGPPTQAADVVRPADAAPAASAAEETRYADLAAASAGRQESTHDAGNAAAAPAPQRTWEPPAATAVHQQIRTEEPIGATVDPSTHHDDEHPVHEAFWFAVAQHRTAFDPGTGSPAFVIEPGGWVLALEDRGHEFLVQHTDGRLGVLRDLSNIERG